ncbi:nucleoside deaminase [candidate division KSB1 bacterium]|nr:nucleoside deaminase [candidate division KSB1 bacterium]
MTALDLLDHSFWMKAALEQAEKAFDKNEVPVGAVVVQEGRITGKGYNLVETLQDPTAHAELLAITAAANFSASWRLDDSILYTTLEPCPMCTGAILLARIPTIVYAAADPRYGACGSAVQLARHENFDINVEVISGILEKQSSVLIKSFFQKIRGSK